MTAAVLAAYILSVSQLVAAEFERDRLRRHHDTTTIVDANAMPKPSQAWADAWAKSMTIAPLFPSSPKIEIVHGLIYAFGESKYDDKPKRGDSGKGGCSMGIQVFGPQKVTAFTGYTLEEIESDPAKCIESSRAVMVFSFARNPNHPMAQYAGSATAQDAIEIADQRAALVKAVAAKLPAIGAP